jgi:hypothetical protein
VLYDIIRPPPLFGRYVRVCSHHGASFVEWWCWWHFKNRPFTPQQNFNISQKVKTRSWCNNHNWVGKFWKMMWCPSSLFLAVLCVLYFEPVVGTRSISTRHSTSTLWHSAVLHILRVSYSPRKCNCIQTHCVDNTSIQSWHPSTVLPKTLLIVFRNNIKERRKKKVPLTQMEHMYY